MLLRKEMIMRIDKEKIKSMCALPDDELWAQIVQVGRDHGFTLPSAVPSHSDMERLRDAVNGGSRVNLGAALKIIDSYRKSAK